MRRVVQVVEGSKSLRELMIGVCRQRAVDVECFENAGAALAAVCVKKPAAILSALHLPGLAGSSLVAALKSSPEHRAVPIALVTSSERDAVRRLAGFRPDVVLRKGSDLEQELGAFLDSIGLVRSGEASAGAEQSVTPLAGRRVLVAEDTKVIRLLVRHLLHTAGADVVVVENGREAVDAAGESHFDLMLTDIEMPEMDGPTALRRLRAAGVMLPIFALTGHDGDDFRKQALATGFDGVLVKPVDRTMLINTCARRVGQA